MDLDVPEQNLVNLRNIYRGMTRTFKKWWEKVHDAPFGNEYLVHEYWQACEGKYPTNLANPYHDWSTPQMREIEQLIAGALPFDPFNKEEVDAMRNDWQRNGYLRQDKNLIFEVSVVAMQQVLAQHRKMDEHAGWIFTATSQELNEEKQRMNDKERYSADYWKKNILERISEFVTQRVFGCNAIDFKQGLLRFNAHLVTHDPTKTSRRDRAIIDQTAKTLAPSSLASAWWTIDTGASHNVLGGSSSSSSTDPHVSLSTQQI